MTFKRPYGAGLAALAVGLFAATAAYAEPTVNKGDNAWMLTSTVLVLLMTIPGLALFYGGLVRSKNMLSVLMQVFYTVCIVTLLWALYGYSLAFTGGSDFIGGFSKAFLMGVTPDSKAATFSVDANITELIYICFQMTFAAITPALIVGAFAERMKFGAVLLFLTGGLQNPFAFMFLGPVLLSATALPPRFTLLLGGFAVPLGGFGEVARHTFSIFVGDAKIVLRFGETLICRFPEPRSGIRPVGCGGIDTGIEQAEIILRLRVAAIRGLLQPLGAEGQHLRQAVGQGKLDLRDGRDDGAPGVGS